MEAIRAQSGVLELSRNTSSTIAVTDLMRPAMTGGVIALPVDGPAGAASFKYVEGIPTSKEGTGYPISKLQAIDALIDRLIKLNKQSMLNDIPQSRNGFSETQLDNLVQELGKRVGMAMSTGLSNLQSTIGVSLGTESSFKGIFLNTVA